MGLIRSTWLQQSLLFHVYELTGLSVVEKMVFSLHHWFHVDRLSRRPARIVQADLSHLRSLFNRIMHVGLYGVEGTPPTSAPPREYSGEALRLEDLPVLEPDDPRAVDFRTSLRTWFHGSSWSSLTRAHLLSWLGWSIFNARFENLSTEQETLARKALAMMERRAGTSLPDGAGPSPNLGANGKNYVEPLRLTLDPMSVQSRPLIAYAVINFVSMAVRKWLEWKYDAQYETIGGTT